MSLNDSDASAKVKIVLKNPEQYQLWKARVTAACWAATRQNIFEVKDETCVQALAAFEHGELKNDWVGKCWLIITSSLHDDLFLKIAHVSPGHVGALLEEIRAALLVNIAEDVQPLRVELYSASMQNTGNDLQSYISFIIQRRDRLLFLGVKIPANELVHIFLKGLHNIFQPLQVYFAVPGSLPDSFDKAVEIVRKFAASPTVHVELNKLKSNGMSQNIFAAISKEKQTCKRFATTGRCYYGERCRFSHTSTPSSPSSTTPTSVHLQSNSNPQTQTGTVHTAPSERKRDVLPVKCEYCQKGNHTLQECRKRAADLQNAKALLASVEQVPEREETELPTPTVAVSNSFAFVFSAKLKSKCQLAETQDSKELVQGVSHQTTASERDCAPLVDNINLPVALANIEKQSGVNKNDWVLDSGASMSATHCERDCVDIRPCNVEVTAAGATFVVLRRGTAIIKTINSLGIEQAISVADCLISPLFPCKLLALQAFTRKGFTVMINNDTLEIGKAQLKEKLLGNLDKASGLYILNCVSKGRSPVEQDFITQISLLAKTYGGVIPIKEYRVLWRLHLRHGHRNFRDLCRQYSLPAPKDMPSCKVV